jgi:hypothetical protein
VLVFVVVFTLALPHVGVLWRPHSTDGFFAQPNPPCDAPWHTGWNLARWNRCQHEQMWLNRPMPLYALHGVWTPTGIATSFVLAAGLFGCLVLLRRDLRSAGVDLARQGEREHVDRQLAEAV